MDEEEDDVKTAKAAEDAEFVKAQLLQEFESFMTLPKALKLLRTRDLDGLLFAFSELEGWLHREDPQDLDDGR
ncbi:MAG TPA: hypothetical protein VGR56_07190 [Nitrososphaerales archaeon]|nr:hypothetical protein [Nitrososphaerales archaeon]